MLKDEQLPGPPGDARRCGGSGLRFGQGAGGRSGKGRTSRAEASRSARTVQPRPLRRLAWRRTPYRGRTGVRRGGASKDPAEEPEAAAAWPSSPDEASLSGVFRSVAVPQTGSGARRFLAFAGPGFLVAVGYMDPGNWATDIAGGSAFGYELLSVVLLSGLMAILLQALSAKLGIVTGRDLAQACRDAYAPRVAVALWLLAEVGICACDLAELLGDRARPEASVRTAADAGGLSDGAGRAGGAGPAAVRLPPAGGPGDRPDRHSGGLPAGRGGSGATEPRRGHVGLRAAGGTSSPTARRCICP